MRRFFILICCTILLYSCVNTDPKPVNTTSETSSEPALSPEEQEIERGRILFASTCKLCHGADGTLALNGAKDLSKSTLSREEKILVITNGRKTMAAYKSVFTEDEIKLLANYVESLKK